MILGLGTDIIDITRIARMKSLHRFLDRAFTLNESSAFKTNGLPPESIAGAFAAKEAVAKALGTGFNGFSLRDIEILKSPNGKPYVNLYQNARTRLEALGASSVLVSISHEKNYAVAVAIIE